MYIYIILSNSFNLRWPSMLHSESVMAEYVIIRLSHRPSPLWYDFSGNLPVTRNFKIGIFKDQGLHNTLH